MRGLPEIAGMVEAAQGRIAIMPGGGITADNIASIAHSTGASEFHSSARTAFPSPVRFRKLGMAMGDLRDREYRRFTVREESVRALIHPLATLAEESQTI
jgi:copper homeostasis protein